MPTDPNALVADTTDMVLIHRVFRRGFARLPDLVAATADGDATRAASLTAHARELVDGLHHHHTNEDELLWPRLRQRAELDGDLLDRMQTQHDELDRRLTQVGAALTAGEWGTSSARRSDLTAAMRDVADLLGAHLDEEEREILPLVHRHVTEAEWAELGERGMASVPRPRRLALLGEILTDTSPAERRAFLARVPLPARIAFRLFGARAHRRTAAELAAPVPARAG